MPSKKKKYNARFPAGRIKKIMQTDEEVGKVAQAVPVIISKALEMFIESLLKKSAQITQSRNAKTLTPSHMKQCILSENRFDFLKDLVKNIPDASVQEDNENNALAESNVDFGIITDEPVTPTPVESSPPRKERRKEPSATTTRASYSEQSSSGGRTPVIQFGPNLPKPECPKFSFSVNSLLGNQDGEAQEDHKKLHITIASQAPQMNRPASTEEEVMTSLVPVTVNSYRLSSSSTGDNLCIDEDYDN